MLIAGLFLIVLAWAYQVFSLSKGNKTVRPSFLALYAVGAAMLAIEGGVLSAPDTISVLNALSFAFAALAFVFLRKGR